MLWLHIQTFHFVIMLRRVVHFKILHVGLRNAVGFNQARFGVSSMSTTEDITMFNETYIYKSEDTRVGWCPPREPRYKTSGLILSLEGIHLLTGFMVRGCSEYPCAPYSARYVFFANYTSIRNWPPASGYRPIFYSGYTMVGLIKSNPSVLTTAYHRNRFSLYVAHR